MEPAPGQRRAQRCNLALHGGRRGFSRPRARAVAHGQPGPAVLVLNLLSQDQGFLFPNSKCRPPRTLPRTCSSASRWPRGRCWVILRLSPAAMVFLRGREGKTGSKIRSCGVQSRRWLTPSREGGADRCVGGVGGAKIEATAGTDASWGPSGPAGQPVPAPAGAADPHEQLWCCPWCYHLIWAAFPLPS